MSTNYTINVYRKVDGKKLGAFAADMLKSIVMFSDLSDKLGFNDYGVNEKCKFEPSVLNEINRMALDKIKQLNQDILNKSLMACMAKKVEVKDSFEEDIGYLKDEINEYNSVAYAAAYLYGAIALIVEDLYVDGSMAYIVNGKDLPTTKEKYGDGPEYDKPMYIWMDSVYFNIEVF